MSKGLEALKRLDSDMYYYENGVDLERHNEDLSIVEKELKENERLKTAYLENLLNEESKEYIYKKLKALEIIKKKRVDCYAVVESKSLIDMNERFWFPSEEWNLTQEEYDLLKEVLLCH